MNAETKHGGAMDVLAVLRDRASYLRDEGYDWTADQLLEISAAVAELIEAASMLEKEFRRIYPIYYYAEPWAHETNVPLKSVKAALANVGHKS